MQEEPVDEEFSPAEYEAVFNIWVADRLKTVRKERLEDIAFRLGVSDATVFAYENRGANPPLYRLVKLGQAMRTSIENLCDAFAVDDETEFSEVTAKDFALYEHISNMSDTEAGLAFRFSQISDSVIRRSVMDILKSVKSPRVANRRMKFDVSTSNAPDSSDPKFLYKQVGRRLAALRKMHGFTPLQLAELLGTSQIQMYKYQNGGGTIKSARLGLAAHFFDANMDFFCHGWDGYEGEPTVAVGSPGHNLNNFILFNKLFQHGPKETLEDVKKKQGAAREIGTIINREYGLGRFRYLKPPAEKGKRLNHPQI